MMQPDSVDSKNRPGVSSNTLLSEGKSSRLLEMRRKSVGAVTPIEDQEGDELVAINKLDKAVKEEFLKARQLIDQQLTEVLRKYPANKQDRFFKIRFGVSVEQLKELSIKEIFSLLGVKQKVSLNMTRMTGLDYFGRSLLK